MIMVLNISIFCHFLRNNPWPAVPGQTLMPECRWRTDTVNLRKKCRCRSRHSGIPGFYFWLVGCALWAWWVYPVHITLLFNAGLFGIWWVVSLVPEWKLVLMPKPVRYQNKDPHRNAAVLDWNAECRCRWHRTRYRCPAINIRMANAIETGP